jgi:hypothetical protein
MGGTPKTDLTQKNKTLATRIWGEEILRIFSPSMALAQSFSQATNFYETQTASIKPYHLDRLANDSLFQCLALPRESFVFSQANFDSTIWLFVFFHELAHLTPKAQHQALLLNKEFECDQLALELITSLYPERSHVTQDILAFRSAIYSDQEQDPVALAMGIDRSHSHALALLHDLSTDLSDPDLIKQTEKTFGNLLEISQFSGNESPQVLQKIGNITAKYLSQDRQDLLKRRIDLYTWAHAYLRHGTPKEAYSTPNPHTS